MLSFTGSKGALALTAFVGSIPSLAGLVTGVYVDRWNKKWTMIISDVLRGLFALGIFLVAISSSSTHQWTLPVTHRATPKAAHPS